MDKVISMRNIVLMYFLLTLVYVSGLILPLMEFDSAQHATMAMRMYLENDFIHLFKGTEEYLDKPHMHFWLSALSFKLFGLYDWAYRLPALLFTVLGAYSCYNLARDLYKPSAGHIASLIFLSSQAIILANHDVRTDAVLTGASIFSIWQLVKYVNTKKLLPAILGSIGLGVAFSTKGQLAILMIGSAMFCHVLYSRKWNSVFSWKVLVGVIAFLVASTPMLYAYYHQFDIYPDKIVHGQRNVSGIKFIFWDQSFNRLTGDGFKANNTDYFFFFHTLLWAFLPWALICYIAIFDRTKEIISLRFKHKKGVEFLTLGGFWLVMIIINLSKSKLPHYMNSLFPLLAVLLSGYLVFLFENSKNKKLRILLFVQYFVIAIGSLVIIALVTYVFPASLIKLISYGILLAILFFFYFKKLKAIAKIVILSVLFSVFVNFSLNTHFYPSLLEYQAGLKVVQLIEKKQIAADDIYVLGKRNSWSLNFYSARHTPAMDLSRWEDYKGKWLLAYERDMPIVEASNLIWNDHIELPHYRITMLKLGFLNPKTRKDYTKKAYLIQIK